jgi:hypothetical protein
MTCALHEMRMRYRNTNSAGDTRHPNKHARPPGPGAFSLQTQVNLVDTTLSPMPEPYRSGQIRNSLRRQLVP